MIPLSVRSLAMAIQMPNRPKLVVCSNRYARGKRSNHMPAMEIKNGLLVSPAPLNTPNASMERPKAG